MFCVFSQKHHKTVLTKGCYHYYMHSYDLPYIVLCRTLSLCLALHQTQAGNLKIEDLMQMQASLVHKISPLLSPSVR